MEKTIGKIIESGIKAAKHHSHFRHAISGLKIVKVKYVYTDKRKEYKDFIPINFKTNFTHLLEKKA